MCIRDRYERLADQLNRLLKEMRAETIEYKEFLRQIVVLNNALRQGEKASDPRIDTEVKMAFYDNLGRNTDLALKVNETAITYAAPGFEDNHNFSRTLRRKLSEVVNGDEEMLDTAYNICVAHKEEIRKEQDDH